MDTYVTGAAVKHLRERRGITQSQLAGLLGVSDKAVSKWETGRGYPDITLLEPLASALGATVPELLSGELIVNKNISGNMLRGHFHVCPVCGNVIFASGGALIGCCGLTLPPLECEDVSDEHNIICEPVEDETYVTVNHSMSKSHYISFLAFVSCDKAEIKKLYAEGAAEARFNLRGGGYLFCFCNRHGLFRKKV